MVICFKPCYTLIHGIFIIFAISSSFLIYKILFFCSTRFLKLDDFDIASMLQLPSSLTKQKQIAKSLKPVLTSFFGELQQWPTTKCPHWNDLLWNIWFILLLTSLSHFFLFFNGDSMIFIQPSMLIFTNTDCFDPLH